MKDYYNVSIYDDYISISLYLEYEEVEKIAGKMEEANADAYMNGYNWEMFLNKYLEYNAPEILDVIDPDSEAGMYSAYINDVNEEKLRKHLYARFALVEAPSSFHSIAFL